MKFGHYAVDVNNVSKHSKLKFIGKSIYSHEHKHARHCGKEVWHWGPTSGWQLSPEFGVYYTRPKPKVIQMLELIGAV